MTGEREAGQEGAIEGRAEETPPAESGAESRGEPKVVRFPDRMRPRQPRPPAGFDDPEGPDPGPSAA